MKIRSITCFFDPKPENTQNDVEKLADFARRVEIRVRAAGFELESKRLATTPFPTYTSEMSQMEALEWLAGLQTKAEKAGFTYLGCGPALGEYPESFAMIPSLLAKSANLFCGAVIADRFQVYPIAVRAAAKVIVQAAKLEPNGFANLQFAALANVPAGSPFFPAAYYKSGEGPAFALAVECADYVLQAFNGASSLQMARSTLLARLEGAAGRLEQGMCQLGEELGVRFLGFDFSPAPYPQDWCSLGAAVEAVGQNETGRDGSLAAAAVIADTLDTGHWMRSGFNGLMLPVLEDSGLARRADEGTLAVKDLLLYSAVCGTGLDTVPIPGDSTEEEITAVLFDVAVLSVRLGKPLTARLMPIPGKKAGEQTNFDFDYFAPSRVLSLNPGRVGLPLNGEETIPLSPRHVHQHMRRGC